MTDDDLDLDSLVFYAISVGDPDGIPAVELDITTNEYNALIFTSRLAAYQYCSKVNPKLYEKVYQLDKKEEKDRKFQVGLIRLARVCALRYANITGLVFDHPGHNKVESRYARMSDVLALAAPSSKKARKSDLISFIEDAMTEKD